MNKWQSEVQDSLLDNEKQVIEQLENQYKRALNDINKKIRLFDSDIKQLDEALNTDGLDDRSREVFESRRRSKVYQKQYQEALQKQIAATIDKLQADEYSTIEQYLKNCYTDGYVGTMYDIANQGIPIIAPIDQASVVRAVLTDSKISKGLYASLGIDANLLKKQITAEVSRGIATGLSYRDMARNLNNVAGTGLSNARRIVRTEGHRIQNASAFDAQQTAKKKGCEVVKQWNSALDGRTRTTHRLLDGQIRETDEYFEIAGKKAKYPGDFGDPAEDCNCRCALLTRAKWALDEDELKTLKERAAYYGLTEEKKQTFEDFKGKYLKASKMASESSGNDWSKTAARTLSNKEKEELVKYAKAKGVAIGDIDSFDGDPNLFKVEIDTISKTVKEYGINRTISVGSRILDDDDFAITEGNAIIFNTKALRDRKATEFNINNGNRFASKVLEDIALHETGHVIEQENNVNSIEIAKKAYYNITGKYVSTKVIKNYLLNDVSRYSAQVQSEIVSEVIVANKNRPTEFTKEFLSLLKGAK